MTVWKSLLHNLSEKKNDENIHTKTTRLCMHAIWWIDWVVTSSLDINRFDCPHNVTIPSQVSYKSQETFSRHIGSRFKTQRGVEPEKVLFSFTFEKKQTEKQTIPIGVQVGRVMWMNQIWYANWQREIHLCVLNQKTKLWSNSGMSGYI